jgi:hypothetical protein
MSVIERIRKNKLASYSASLSLIVVAAGVMTWTSWPERKISESRAYFTVDDGKTWYEDSIDLIPPYTHEGKPAARAMIYSYAGGSKKFCGYLQQFGPTAKAALDAAVEAGKKKNPPEAAHLIAYGIEFSGRAEVKSPGAAEWVPIASSKATPILQIKAPDGSELDQVMP